MALPGPYPSNPSLLRLLIRWCVHARAGWSLRISLYGLIPLSIAVPVLVPGPFRPLLPGSIVFSFRGFRFLYLRHLLCQRVVGSCSPFARGFCLSLLDCLPWLSPLALLVDVATWGRISLSRRLGGCAWGALWVWSCSYRFARLHIHLVNFLSSSINFVRPCCCCLGGVGFFWCC